MREASELYIFYCLQTVPMYSAEVERLLRSATQMNHDGSNVQYTKF